MVETTTKGDHDLYSGEKAADLLVSKWEEFLGKVDMEVVGNYLIIRRGHGDMTFFLSLVDDTAVYVADDSVTTRHIPENFRAEGDLPDERVNMLARATNNQSTGSYPLGEDGVYALGFREDGDHYQLQIGLTDDTFEIVEA